MLRKFSTRFVKSWYATYIHIVVKIHNACDIPSDQTMAIGIIIIVAFIL